MSLARAWSVALLGLEGRIIEVEADIGGGLPRTILVGRPRMPPMISSSNTP